MKRKKTRRSSVDAGIYTSSETAKEKRTLGMAVRIVVAALALLLVMEYWLLPAVEERSIAAGSGHRKLTLEDGDSFSSPWTPVLEGSSELHIFLRGGKKAGKITITVVLTDPAGQEAASAVLPAEELANAESIRLQGKFRRGAAYSLTIRTAGEGKISLLGEEDEKGNFLLNLRETGIEISRNPVLLYFALGLVLLAVVPVNGPDGNGRRRTGKRWMTADLLPWGTFLLILAAGLLVDLRKPMFQPDGVWIGWDEEIHLSYVQDLALYFPGGLRSAANGLVTWHAGYLPLVAGYNLGGLLNLVGWRNPDLPYRCAVIVSTICYAAACAAAVKHAPRYKVSFLLAGTMPILIFQATCATYDTTVAAAVILGAALWLETLEQPGRMSGGRAAALTAVLAFGTVAKPAYSVILLILLTIPGKKFGSPREKRLFRLYTVMMLCWCAVGMLIQGPYGDVMGGDARFAGTDSAAQIRGMLSDPIGRGLLPVRFLWENLYSATVFGIDYWGYVGRGLYGLMEMYLLLILLVAPLCMCSGEKTGKSPLSPGRRLTFGLCAYLAELILVYAMYLTASPVGDYIVGMQARYFIPMWICAMLALMWPQAVRERARLAGDVLTWTVFALVCWANIWNAVIHLQEFSMI